MIQPAANAVDAYLKHLQKEFAHGDATEHTHRPALKTKRDALMPIIESFAKSIDARA